jgi:hypothetical protein
LRAARADLPSKTDGRYFFLVAVVHVPAFPPAARRENFDRSKVIPLSFPWA